MIHNIVWEESRPETNDGWMLSPTEGIYATPSKAWGNIMKETEKKNLRATR